MKRSLFPIFALALFFVSCTKEKKEVVIFVNSTSLDQNEVIVDDTLPLKNYQENLEYNRFILKSGEHTLSINNKKEKFNIEDKGGILNIGHSEFVIYPIKYSAPKDELSDLILDVDFPIIISDTVIYSKDVASDQKSLISFLKNPMSKDIFNYELEKVNKNELFINKNWDYDIDEMAKDSLSIKTTATMGVVEYKRKIIKADLFLLLSRISDKYHVEEIEDKELIGLINNFKKKEK